MSLDAYPSEQRVFYRHDDATTYYGFHVSGTSFSDDTHPFTSAAEREAFVTAAVEGLDLAQHDGFILAAVAALAVYGSDFQCEANEYTLQDAYPEEAEAVLDAARAFVARQ